MQRDWEEQDSREEQPGVTTEGDAAMPEDSPLGPFARDEGETPGASGLPGEPGGATEAGLAGGAGDLGGGGDLAGDAGALDEEGGEAA